MPAGISEIYDIMEKIKKGVHVDRAEVVHLMKMALSNESNFGIWIKKVRDDKENDNYISVVMIGESPKGKRRIAGYRVNIRK